jgi:hypothetical protein
LSDSSGLLEGDDLLVVGGEGRGLGDVVAQPVMLPTKFRLKKNRFYLKTIQLFHVTSD